MTWSVYLAWAVGFAMGAGYVWFGWRWAREARTADLTASQTDSGLGDVRHDESASVAQNGDQA